MNRLAELRKESGLSQAFLGKQIGVAQNTLCNWEKGKREIDQESLLKLSSFFNVSLDYLMGKSKYKNLEEAIDCNWGLTSNPDFDAAFDFADLLKDCREKQGISLAEMGAVLGCTEEQYAGIEQGLRL